MKKLIGTLVLTTLVGAVPSGLCAAASAKALVVEVAARNSTTPHMDDKLKPLAAELKPENDHRIVTSHRAEYAVGQSQTYDLANENKVKVTLVSVDGQTLRWSLEFMSADGKAYFKPDVSMTGKGHLIVPMPGDFRGGRLKVVFLARTL